MNSERGLVERILSGATHRLLHRLHRRMISAALGAGTLLQFLAWVREMRIWGLHFGVVLQLAKLAVLAEKVIEFEIFGFFSSQKEKISFGDALVLLGFFPA